MLGPGIALLRNRWQAQALEMEVWLTLVVSLALGMRVLFLRLASVVTNMPQIEARGPARRLFHFSFFFYLAVPYRRMARHSRSATISATSLTCIVLAAVFTASESMIMQNGQPTASVSRPVAIASRKRLALTRSRPCSSSFHI